MGSPLIPNAGTSFGLRFRAFCWFIHGMATDAKTMKQRTAGNAAGLARFLTENGAIRNAAPRPSPALL
jgi:hypothetical protein